MPIAAKRAFRIGIKIGTIVNAVCTTEASFVPGTAVVIGQVHRFSVRCGQVEAAVTAEFVEERGFQVIVIGLGRIGTTLAEDEAQAADGTVIAAQMDRLTAGCREVFVVQASQHQLGLRFDEQAVAVQFRRLAVFDAQAFAARAEVGTISVWAIGMKVGIVTAPFGDDVRIRAGVTEPGSVDSTGQGVILTAAVIIVRRGDAPFAEEAVDALIVGGIIIANLDSVVFAVIVRTVDVSAIRPSPDTGGITLVLEKTQVAHALAQGVDGIAIQAVAVIDGAEERLRVGIDGLGQFGQVPFRILGVRHPHGVLHIAAVLDGGGHIPQAALINRLTAEGGILAIICNEQQMFRPGDFLPQQETFIVDLDQSLGTGGCTGHIHFIPIGFTVQVSLHPKDPVPAAVRTHIQPLVFRIVLHVHQAAVGVIQSGHLAAGRHIPAGPIGQSQLRIPAGNSRFTTEQGISCIQIQLDRAFFGRFQIAKNDLAARAHGGNRAAIAGAVDGILAAHQGHAAPGLPYPS